MEMEKFYVAPEVEKDSLEAVKELVYRQSMVKLKFKKLKTN